jgi:predicted metal-dependent peptidase
MNEKIIAAINKLICSEYQYWGEFSLFINFKKSDALPTCGVTIKNCSPLYYYNESFVEGLTDKELMFVHIHELFHLICDHCQRTKNRDKQLSNIAQDMLINDSIKEHMPEDFVSVPKIGLVFIPPEYKGEKVFEPLYDWMSEEYEKWKKKNPGKKNIKINIDKNGKGSMQPGDGKGEKQDNKDKSGGGKDKPEDKQKGKGKGEQPTLDEIFEGLQDYQFDVHFDETIDADMRKQIMDDIINNLKNRGFQTANIEKMLERLQKTKKNYLKEIIRSVSFIKGYVKKKSFKRPSRKNIFGLKGKVKYGCLLNVLLDTSGSMNGYFEKILSVIFRDDINVNLVQCDTEVKCVESVRSKKQLQQIKIAGLGGTTLQPGIDKIVERYNRVNTVILTDGFTDNLDVSKLKRCLIISTQEMPKVTGNYRGVILKEKF